jgi:DNA-binding GntR family transcriptional regulator
LETHRRLHREKRTTGPILKVEDIEKMRATLANKPRDLLLFDLATETGIGMKKLLLLRVKHLSGIVKGERISIRSEKDKNLNLKVTDNVYETFQKYLKILSPNPNDYLFKSKKGQQPLNLSSVSNMINGWYKDAGIKNCYGAISLRRTWEYHRKDAPHAALPASGSKKESIFKPIEKFSVQKTIYNELFNAIVSGKITPGMRLTTAGISEEFKVSQAPVRVALNWLEAKGFIVPQKKSGSIVKELTIEELHEIVQVRIILETAAAKLSYKVRTEDTLKLLESIIEKYKSAYTFEASDQLNRLFHQTLYRDVGMPLLVTMITDLYDRFSPYAAFAFANINRMHENPSDAGIPEYYHIKILEGLRHKNLGNILENIKMDLERAMHFTEKALEKKS